MPVQERYAKASRPLTGMPKEGTLDWREIRNSLATKTQWRENAIASFSKGHGLLARACWDCDDTSRFYNCV